MASQSSPLTMALLGGGAGANSPYGMAMYDPQTMAAMQRLGFAQNLASEGMSSAPAYPMQALSRLGQALLGGYMLKQGYGDLEQLGQQRQQETLGSLQRMWGGEGGSPGSMPAAPAVPQSSTPQQPIPQFATRVAALESGGKSDATNPLFPPERGGPVGPQQFTADTWNAFAKANPQQFQNMTPDQVLAARSDPNISAAATTWFKGQNAPILTAAGVQPSDANLSVAHALGGAGAAGVLKFPDNTPLSQALQATQPDKASAILAENPTYQSMTVGQLRARYGGDGTQVAQAAPQQQPQIGLSSAPGASSIMDRMRMIETEMVSHRFNPVIQDMGKMELQRLNTELQMGRFETVQTPNGPVSHNLFSNEQKPWYTGRPAVTTGPHNETLVVMPGTGEVRNLGNNPSGMKAGSPEQIIAEIGPKINAGTATPQEQANYATAVEVFRKPQVTTEPSTQSIVSVPTQSLPPGMPQPNAGTLPHAGPQPGGVGGNATQPTQPAPGQHDQGPSDTGVQRLTPGGAPTPAVTERYAKLDALEKTSLGARDELQQAQLLKNTLHELGSTGPATSFLANLSRYAEQIGVPLETIKKFGLPNGATEAQAAALANSLAMEVARTAFPQRITNTDLRTAQSIKPNPDNPMAANDYLLENTIIPKAQRDVERYGSVVNLTNPKHPDFDSSLGNLNAKLYEFDQAHPLSSYTPGFQPKPTQGGATPTAQAGQQPAAQAQPSRADIEAELRRRGLLK